MNTIFQNTRIFPVVVGNDAGDQVYAEGMSIRAYFAAAALQGLLAGDCSGDLFKDDTEPARTADGHVLLDENNFPAKRVTRTSISKVTERAVTYADALIFALNGGIEGDF